MSTAELKLELIHWLTETDDEVVLNSIEAIRVAHAHEDNAEHQILQERIDKYKSGEMQFSDWNNVKNRIQSRG